MYSAGPSAEDTVVTLPAIPQSSSGAPCPVILSSDYYLVVAFYLEEQTGATDGSNPREVGLDTEGLPFAIITFEKALAYYHGPPNDEALAGHPLYSRGLRHYGAFEVIHSSWLRHLAQMNRVHPGHKEEMFSGDRHFIFTFHDSIFECIAEGYAVSCGTGSLKAATKLMLAELK